MQSNAPDTFVLATSRAESVRNFAAMAFRAVGIDLEWAGSGRAEKGIDRKTGDCRVTIDERFYRPAEVDLLVGDPSKAERLLGWKAETSLEELCTKMVEADLRRAETGTSF
jgi:GDPmannose 4,6-dehydratase